MEAFNIKFVAAVEKQRVLYDLTLTDYSRKDMTDQAWRHVASEVSLTVSECKERWKNLRTAFLRSLKARPGSSGSKTKKMYYLHEALQFILPFTKASTSGSLTRSPQGSEVTDPEDLGFQPLYSNPAYPESADFDTSSPPLPPPSAAPTPPAPQDSSPQQPENTLPRSRQLQLKPSYRKQASRKKKRKMPASESDSDRAGTEYRDAGKSANRPDDGRKEGIVHFLNSLVPDLLTLTDPQLRSFKRRTLLLIDEVTGTTPLESICEPSYPVFPRTCFSETPSPASTSQSTYDPSAPTTPQMEMPLSNSKFDLQTLEHPQEQNTS